MNRRSFLTSLSAASVMTAIPTLASAELLYIEDTSDGFLNLRSGPGTRFEIVTRLYGGVEVDGIGQSGSWRQLICPDGTIGWASGRFLTTQYRQQRHYDARVAPTSDGYLNMRSGPGTNYPAIQRLHTGTPVNDGGSSGNWINVYLPDGRSGWAYGAFLE